METLDNIITLTDSYKITHWEQYPPDTTNVFSFFESRGGKFSEVTFFGLQYFLKKYLAGKVVTLEKIAEAREIFSLHFGNESYFNEDGWKYIVEKYEGRLPVSIKAIPEGSIIPNRNALMTIENLDPKLPWLTNYLETLLSEVWYPCTVATMSRQMKNLILDSLKRTGDPKLVDFKLHDFGFRGSTCPEASGLGGVAHLVNSMGTDTLSALIFARKYYGETMAGYSVAAAEHSTITSFGLNGERDAFKHMLKVFPTGIISVVSDSYDIYNACKNIWGKELRESVLNRDGILVVRPDSGNPPEVVVKVLNILGEAFGFEINNKGFKVLEPHVRVIQGDGIDYEMLGSVLEAMEKSKWSADNVAFGSGGGLLQKVNRDTQKFAFKCSARKGGWGWYEVSKNPITDPSKASKAGRLKLIKENGSYKTVREGESFLPNELLEVFRNGEILREYTFSEIRKLSS